MQHKQQQQIILAKRSVCRARGGVGAGLGQGGSAFGKSRQYSYIWVEAESHLLFRCSGSVASEILAAASVHSSSELPRRSFLLLLLVLLLAGLFDDLKESGGLASSLFRFYGQLRRPLNHILPQHGVAEQAVLELLPRELWIRLVIHNLATGHQTACDKSVQGGGSQARTVEAMKRAQRQTKLLERGRVWD